ncbi:hypothetical protein F5Y10DRAFT_155433 [Nemania abortiva]|nr:hypothetical protein F5Y10DRAFT_155433 [Nemania abortiva]
MTTSPNTPVSIDVTTRQMSTTSLDIQPASYAEILGIATATCLLASFLCCVLLVGLRMLWQACYPKFDSTSAPKTSGKRDEATPSVGKWSFIACIRSRDSHGDQQDGTPTPHFTNSAGNRRMQILRNNHKKQYYYTQMAARCKPASRKPLPQSNFTITPIRWKDTTLDMEEGLSLRSHVAAAVNNAHDESAGSNKMASSVELEAKDADDSNLSFLPCRTASL